MAVVTLGISSGGACVDSDDSTLGASLSVGGLRPIGSSGWPVVVLLTIVDDEESTGLTVVDIFSLGCSSI